MAKKSLSGGKMYLFTQPKNTNLIISAHGAMLDKSFIMPSHSTIWFCGRHGKSTVTDADDIVNALSANGNNTLFDELKLRGLHPYFSPTNKILDYELSKFAGRHGGGEYENYDEYDVMIKKGFDILSPRNRWYSKEIKLSDVLTNSEIKKKTYKNIYCSFCRC